MARRTLKKIEIEIEMTGRGRGAPNHPARREKQMLVGSPPPCGCSRGKHVAREVRSLPLILPTRRYTSLLKHSGEVEPGVESGGGATKKCCEILEVVRILPDLKSTPRLSARKVSASKKFLEKIGRKTTPAIER